jgi:hypothetical protein
VSIKYNVKIRALLLPFLYLMLLTNVFAQEQKVGEGEVITLPPRGERELEVVKELIIDSTLFRQPNQGNPYALNYRDDVKRPYSHAASFSRRKEIKNIHDFVRLDTNWMKFRISYGCGCGKTTMRLVTDGVKRKDKTGKGYYQTRLLFTSNDMCKGMCEIDVAFNLTKLKQSPKRKVYVKFEDYEQLIALE